MLVFNLKVKKFWAGSNQTLYKPKSPHTSFALIPAVKLFELPSRFSFDEALLLCPGPIDWVAWIPDRSEAVH